MTTAAADKVVCAYCREDVPYSGGVPPAPWAFRDKWVFTCDKQKIIDADTANLMFVDTLEDLEAQLEVLYPSPHAASQRWRLFSETGYYYLPASPTPRQRAIAGMPSSVCVSASPYYNCTALGVACEAAVALGRLLLHPDDVSRFTTEGCPVDNKRPPEYCAEHDCQLIALDDCNYLVHDPAGAARVRARNERRRARRLRIKVESSGFITVSEFGTLARDLYADIRPWLCEVNTHQQYSDRRYAVLNTLERYLTVFELLYGVKSYRQHPALHAMLATWKIRGKATTKALQQSHCRMQGSLWCQWFDRELRVHQRTKPKPRTVWRPLGAG